MAVAGLLLTAACVRPPAAPLTPEAALPACEAAAGAELARLGFPAGETRLEPLELATVEHRSPPPHENGVAMLIRGRGQATGAGVSGFRYTCVIGSRAGVLHMAVEPDRSSAVLAECAQDPGGAAACLQKLAAAAERQLAQAEAAAVARARQVGGRRSEVDEPAATSIGAWRVYRDAECSRRAQDGMPLTEPACLVELTRLRLMELGAEP
jgi:uncharacterized protein YecT (DUF1311 family)